MTHQEAVDRVSAALTNICSGSKVAKEIARSAVDLLAERGQIDVPKNDRA